MSGPITGGKGKSRRGGRMDDVIIRKLEPLDIEAVRKIDEKITGKPWEAFWEGKIISRIQTNPESSLAAEVGGVLVGFCLGDIRGWDFNIPKSGWIDIIGTDPDFHGKGIARKLLDAEFDFFKKNDVHNVHVLIDWDDISLVDYFSRMDFKRGKFVHLQKEI